MKLISLHYIFGNIIIIGLIPLLAKLLSQLHSSIERENWRFKLDSICAKLNIESS